MKLNWLLHERRLKSKSNMSLLPVVTEPASGFFLSFNTGRSLRCHRAKHSIDIFNGWTAEITIIPFCNTNVCYVLITV